MVLSFSNSSSLEYFNVIGWHEFWFLLLLDGTSTFLFMDSILSNGCVFEVDVWYRSIFLGCDESRTRVRGGKSRVTLFFQFIGAETF